MIKLLKPCSILVDNGRYCGDGCCWFAWWESENFLAGEEIDENDPRINISDLEELVDFVRVD
jgi:hypothetical protein